MRVWLQAYIAFCTRCRNFAVQSDCRTLNYIILTSSGRLCYLPKFVECCVVTKIQKRSLRSCQNLEDVATITRSLNSKTYYALNHHMINAFLPYKMQCWLATRLAKKLHFNSVLFLASLFDSNEVCTWTSIFAGSLCLHSLGLVIWAGHGSEHHSEQLFKQRPPAIDSKQYK